MRSVSCLWSFDDPIADKVDYDHDRHYQDRKNHHDPTAHPAQLVEWAQKGKFVKLLATDKALVNLVLRRESRNRIKDRHNRWDATKKQPNYSNDAYDPPIAGKVALEVLVD